MRSGAAEAWGNQGLRPQRAGGCPPRGVRREGGVPPRKGRRQEGRVGEGRQGRGGAAEGGLRGRRKGLPQPTGIAAATIPEF